MPGGNNFYASFSNVDKEHLKKVFELEGWISRKVTWTDFELTNNWSELILEGEDNCPLLNGLLNYSKFM